MTPQQLYTQKQRIQALRNVITQFIKSRERFYKKRGFTRTNEVDAITKILKYMDVRRGTGLATHMKMVELREDDFMTLMPHTMEDPENMGKANLMKRAIQECKVELADLKQKSQQLKIAS